VSATFTPNRRLRACSRSGRRSGSGIGRVESSPAGLDCKSGKCTASFVEGTKLLLGAMPTRSRRRRSRRLPGLGLRVDRRARPGVHVAFDQLHYQASISAWRRWLVSAGGFITRQSGIVVGTWAGATRARSSGTAPCPTSTSVRQRLVAGYADGGLVAGNYAVTMPGTFRRSV